MLNFKHFYPLSPLFRLLNTPLGVIVQESFSVEMHMLLSVCSQYIFLMKRLCDQGLPANHLNTVAYFRH